MNTIFKQKNTHPFSNAANRLDRLPISRVHFQVLTALGIVYFFDLADLFTLSNVAPALIEHWGIPLSTIANVTAASFLGMFLGASLGGRLSDRIGRKKALNLFVFVFSIASLCNAAAWDIPSLMTFRFLTGFGVAAPWSLRIAIWRNFSLQVFVENIFLFVP